MARRSNAQNNASQASTLGVVSSVTIALGVVAAGAGAYFLVRPIGQDKTASIAPLVDQRTAGATFHLTF